MTAAIKSSLNDLNKALETLEKSALDMQDNKKPRKRTSPPDLFSVTSPQSDVDTKALASRLDGAIAKVEKLLRDGE